MCGIYCVLTTHPDKQQVLEDHVIPSIKTRGPDACHAYRHHVTLQDGAQATIDFTGTVLHLRGKLTTQPLYEKGNGNEVKVLLWNGEVFGGNLKVAPDENDTAVLFQRLKEIDNPDDVNSMTTLFSDIQGPWSFIYYNSINQKLWYARDYFGRRSLVCTTSDDTICLSSVGCNAMIDQEFFELPAKVLYCIELKAITGNLRGFVVKEYPLVSPYLRLMATNQHFQHRCTGIVNELIKTPCSTFSSEQHKCNSTLTCEVSSNCESCGNSATESASAQYMTLQEICDRFLNVFQESIKKRVENIPRNVLSSQRIYSTVGVLFSGGIDSVIIAALAHRFVPPHESIDLINVAFAQQRKVKAPENVKKKHLKMHNQHHPNGVHYDVPDRITGRDALKELPKERQWNFIEVDVTLEELQEERTRKISNLVYPLDSVLDDSIGCAIWFAARGKGQRFVLTNEILEKMEEDYISPVKVLLTGMGADEQLGGYARHRTKFEKLGWQGLSEEMEMEVQRISTRNLGRDDRCISDNGRESRFPFLDENVMAFLHRVPVCVKCDPRLPRGEGEKILLREAAYSIGLHNVSKLPKRAIQFGSKIAKMEGCKEKGSDTCTRLK